MSRCACSLLNLTCLNHLLPELHEPLTGYLCQLARQSLNALDAVGSSSNSSWEAAAAPHLCRPLLLLLLLLVMLIAG